MSEVTETQAESTPKVAPEQPEPPRTRALLTYLQGLADPKREDRAALAELRASLGQDFPYKALRHVLPRLWQDASRRDEDDALLLAGLFALHPESGSASLATALKIVMLRRSSESIEGRFRALLSADRADLAAHLRHAITLVATEKIGINWQNLWKTISGWEHPENFARRAWARDYWAAEKTETSDQTDTANPAANSENA